MSSIQKKSKNIDRESIPTRLLLPVILVAIGGVLLLAVSAAFWTIYNRGVMLDDHLHREAHLIAEGIAHAVAPEMVHNDYSGVESHLLQAASSYDVLSALVINQQGDVISYVVGASSDKAAQPVFSLSHLPPPDSNYHEATQSHPNHLTLWQQVDVGTPIGWVRLEMKSDFAASTMAEVQREAWLLALAVAIPGVLLLGGAILHTLNLMQRHEQEVVDTEEQLKSKAYYDGLTGLPNRHLLFDRFEIAIARSARHHYMMAVCFIDLDNYKPINDQYGHLVGDHTLMAVAHRLKEILRGADTVARLGGDEFIILLSELEDEIEVNQAVMRIAQVFEQPFRVDEHLIEMKASIGYALYPEDSKAATTLIELADQAMYQAKASGRNRIVRYARAGSSDNT